MEARGGATGVSELRWGQGEQRAADLTFNHWVWNLSTTPSSVNNYHSVCFNKWTRADVCTCAFLQMSGYPDPHAVLQVYRRWQNLHDQ